MKLNMIIAAGKKAAISFYELYIGFARIIPIRPG
tara:strand:- start:67 stop:168 length:102 start_codon:yes stop_codon:yes gene_type:complete